MGTKMFERLCSAAARRPILTSGIVLALAVGGGLLALGLRPAAGVDTFVRSPSASYRATADDQRHFGDDAVGIRSQVVGAGRSTRAAEAKAYALAIGEGMSKTKALQAATAAGRLEYAAQLQALERMAVSSGLNGIPSINDPTFIPAIVFDSTRGAHQPKARFSYLFPTKNSALVQVRLRSSLTEAEQARAISWIRQAIRMPRFRS